MQLPSLYLSMPVEQYQQGSDGNIPIRFLPGCIQFLSSVKVVFQV